METTPSATTLALEKYQRERRERKRVSVCECVIIGVSFDRDDTWKVI